MLFSNVFFFLGYIRNKKKKQTNETKLLEEEEKEGIATKQTNMLLVKE